MATHVQGEELKKRAAANDRATKILIDLLLPVVHAYEKEKIQNRLQALDKLIDSLGDAETTNLFNRLEDRTDNLTRLFDYSLHTATRKKFRDRLKAKLRPATMTPLPMGPPHIFKGLNPPPPVPRPSWKTTKTPIDPSEPSDDKEYIIDDSRMTTPVFPKSDKTTIDDFLKELEKIFTLIRAIPSLIDEAKALSDIISEIKAKLWSLPSGIGRRNIILQVLEGGKLFRLIFDHDDHIDLNRAYASPLAQQYLGELQELFDKAQILKRRIEEKRRIYPPREDKKKKQPQEPPPEDDKEAPGEQNFLVDANLIIAASKLQPGAHDYFVAGHTFTTERVFNQFNDFATPKEKAIIDLLTKNKRLTILSGRTLIYYRSKPGFSTAYKAIMESQISGIDIADAELVGLAKVTGYTYVGENKIVNALHNEFKYLGVNAIKFNYAAR